LWETYLNPRTECCLASWAALAAFERGFAVADRYNVQWPFMGGILAGLGLLTFVLSAFANIDVGMGAGMTISLMDLTLHSCARFLKIPLQLLLFVLPIAISQALWGSLVTLPCIVVARLVCVLMVSHVYRLLPNENRNSSVLPFLVHGFWLLLGVGLYDTFMFGLIRGVLGFFICFMGWVVAGGLSVLFMRLLSRHVLKTVEEQA